MNLDLPKTPNLIALIRKGGETHPVVDKLVPALVAVLAVGIETYKNIGPQPDGETARLTFAIEEAARAMLLLSATHGIK